MMKKSAWRLLAAAAAVSILGAGVAQAGGYGSPKQADSKAVAEQAKVLDIVGTAVAAGSFKTLVAAVQAAGLVETLQGPGPFTVFAPTDEAFAKLPAGTVEGLLKEPAKLQTILTYHVVAGKVMAGDVAKIKEAKTVEGRALAIDTSKGVKINDALVTKADIVCSNGVIHVIDTVLLPK